MIEFHGGPTPDDPPEPRTVVGSCPICGSPVRRRMWAEDDWAGHCDRCHAYEYVRGDRYVLYGYDWYWPSGRRVNETAAERTAMLDIVRQLRPRMYMRYWDRSTRLVGPGEEIPF